MSKVYIYVVDRDFGFAPNPFHGICTLATCKPRIRSVARLEDWIFGVGGQRLNSTGQCIFAMKVTRKMKFNAYWDDVEFRDKIPIRNGSRRMMVGDNIYHQNGQNWLQANSHHSHSDGSVNVHNLNTDTSADAVLLSDHFYYFGMEAPLVPPSILKAMGYRNGRNHRTFSVQSSVALIKWVEDNYPKNILLGDPFDFSRAHARYSVNTNAISV